MQITRRVSRDVRLLQRHWSGAICPVISKCSVEIRKNSRTALSSNEGEFVTSTTASAFLRPSPVTLLTPVDVSAQLELGCKIATDEAGPAHDYHFHFWFSKERACLSADNILHGRLNGDIHTDETKHQLPNRASNDQHPHP